MTRFAAGRSAGTDVLSIRGPPVVIEVVGPAAAYGEVLALVDNAVEQAFLVGRLTEVTGEQG